MLTSLNFLMILSIFCQGCLPATSPVSYRFSFPNFKEPSHLCFKINANVLARMLNSDSGEGLNKISIQL